jgi:hypothetical protein
MLYSINDEPQLIEVPIRESQGFLLSTLYTDAEEVWHKWTVSR